jgi:hypothetical protein
MGSQVMEIAVWLWSLAIISVFLGLLFNVFRGMFDGYMDRWEEKYLKNKKEEYLEENILSVNDPLPGEENDKWEDDPDVMAFLENEDKPGPWPEEYDKSYTVGGLSADKNRDFIKFQKKMDANDKK